MNTIKVRKKFLLDKDIIKQIEEHANRRTGSFIGLLNGEVGEESYKMMKKETLSKSHNLCKYL